MIEYKDFEKLNIRVGEIIEAELLPNAKYTTHKITIDFGKEIGQKISCARLVNYRLDELKGLRIIGVINFPEKQIGTSISQVLTLGVPDDNKECVLAIPNKEVPLGGKLY